MDLIRTDIHGRELGYVKSANIDMEVGEESDSINDFEVEFKRRHWTPDITYGCRLFSPETEMGGIISEIGTNTAEDTVTVKGYTWRGMMTKKVIIPKPGEDYAVVSGELHQVLKSLIEKEFPGLFYVDTEDTGIFLKNYQFERYCTLHNGIVKMLKSVGYRMDIKYINDVETENGYVLVKAIPISDYSEDYEFSNDNNMNFSMEDNRRGVNHLICLGKGELKDRIVEHLYINGEGKVDTNQYYTGKEEIAEVYDSSGSEREDLIKNGREKIESIKSKAEYKMTMDKIEGKMDIGDIVGGRDYLTEVSVKKPIGRKIWTVSAGKEKLEYKLEGEK